MDPRRFYFPVVTLNDGGQPDRLRGNAFPISANGDLVTCRHVVSVLAGTQLAVLDRATNRIIPFTRVESHPNTDIDMALLPQALGRPSDYFPILPSGLLHVGGDLNAYGWYSTTGRASTMTDGFFAGHVVGFRAGTPISMTLSFPVIEGLSGSPLVTYHNGSKVVGICIGSESQRVLAHEVVDFREGAKEVRETVNRIVEFGLGYRSEAIEELCLSHGVTPVVTDQRHGDQLG